MDQIAQAMGETKQATQQFVAGAQETQAAISRLSDLARELEELTAQFRLSASKLSN